MSEMMDEAVINMPIGLAMSSPSTRFQYYQRARQVLIEREAYKRWLSESEAKLSKACELLQSCLGVMECEGFDDEVAKINALLKENGR